MNDSGAGAGAGAGTAASTAGASTAGAGSADWAAWGAGSGTAATAASGVLAPAVAGAEEVASADLSASGAGTVRAWVWLTWDVCPPAVKLMAVTATAVTTAPAASKTFSLVLVPLFAGVGTGGLSPWLSSF